MEAQVFHQVRVIVKETFSMNVVFVAEAESRMVIVTAPETLDECGTCGGAGIPSGDCDCNGNVLDECGVCGGTGIPSGACDCEGNVLDECGSCGGGGIADGDCDCAGNVLDECGL